MTPQTQPHTVREHIFDAAALPLGRLATRVATVLIGKRNTRFAPNREGGDRVLIRNAARVQLTGRKIFQKVVYRYSGYLGGLKRIPLSRQVAAHPEAVIRNAVSRMLPKNKLRARMLKRLTIQP